MKKKTISTLVLVLGTAGFIGAQQSQNDPANPSNQGNQQNPSTQSTAGSQGHQFPSEVQYSQTATAHATITGIDQANRVVTLKGERGNVVHVKVGEDAPNFNQLKVGDRVKAQFYQSTALALSKPGEEAPTSGTQQQVWAIPGQSSGGPTRVMVNTSTITATVENINRQNRTVSLKGPQGDTMTVKVDPSVQRFDQLQRGDQVTATITDALALSVQPE